MFICLPALSFVFLILFFRNKFSFLGWRAGYILAAVTLVSFAVIFIEIASLFSSITSSSVFGFWFAMTLLSVGLFWWSDAKRLLKLCTAVPGLGTFDLVCISGIVLILLVNARVAFSFPPNTWDAMTYHLPRVMHWATNASVHFYPTQIYRQLFFLPGAEFCLLHCFLLTGDDRWFNFLQWISLIGCVFSASLIAEFLGASIRGQIFTALFVTTIPMAVLQSTSAQNDLFVSFWVIAFVALALLLRREFSNVVFYTAAAALGLSALAKGTFFVVFPFAFFFLLFLWKKGFKYVFVCFGIVLVLIAGHYARSWVSVDGHSVSTEGADIMMKRHDPGAIVGNTIFQLGSEFLVPWEPVNGAIKKFVQEATTLLGADTKYQDIFGEEVPMIIRPDAVFDEEYASNPLHMILIFVVLVFLWRLRPKGEVWLYCINVIASCFLFVFFIKWQPWITRFHLPLFILFAPMIGVLLGGWKKEVTALIIVLLFGTAFLAIIFSNKRPISEVNNLHNLSRSAYYFMEKPLEFISYYYASKIILSSGCHDVGLDQGGNSWEYPLWALTGYGTVHFRSSNPDSFKGILPCMVVTLNSQQDKGIVLGREIYKLVWQYPPLQIFKRTH